MSDDFMATRKCASDDCRWHTNSESGYCESCRPGQGGTMESLTDEFGWARYRRFTPEPLDDGFSTPRL